MSRVPLKKIVYNNSAEASNGGRFRKENNANNGGKDLENLKYAYGKISEVYESGNGNNQYSSSSSSSSSFSNNNMRMSNIPSGVSSSKLEIIQEEQDFEPMMIATSTAAGTRRRNIINDFLPYNVPLTTAASNSLHNKNPARVMKKNPTINEEQLDGKIHQAQLPVSSFIGMSNNSNNNNINNTASSSMKLNRPVTAKPSSSSLFFPEPNATAMGGKAVTILPAVREKKTPIEIQPNEAVIAVRQGVNNNVHTTTNEAFNSEEENVTIKEEVNQQFIAQLIKEKQEEKELYEAEKLMMCEKIKQLEISVAEMRQHSEKSMQAQLLESKVSILENLLKEKEMEAQSVEKQFILCRGELNLLREKNDVLETECFLNKKKLAEYDKLVEELKSSIKAMSLKEIELHSRVASADEKLNEEREKTKLQREYLMKRLAT